MLTEAATFYGPFWNSVSYFSCSFRLCQLDPCSCYCVVLTFHCFRMMASPQKFALSVGMNDVKIRALILCHPALITEIDPIIVSSTLCEWYPQHRSCHNMLRELRRQYDRSYVTSMFLTEMEKKFHLQDFIHALYTCGYKKLAVKVFRSFLNSSAEVINYVSKMSSDQGQQDGHSRLVYNLKKMVDDARFPNPQLYLSKLGEQCIMKMDQEQDIQKKQLLAEKCVAIVGAEIDAIAITYDEDLPDKSCFKKLQQLINQTSKPSLMDGVYYGRLANAYAITGRFEECEELLQASLNSINFVAPCIEVLFMILFQVQVRLFRFEKNPNADDRRSLLLWAQVGLDCLEDTRLDSMNTWRRSLILRMVFCLLGLGYRGNVIDKCPVNESDIQEAKELLTNIDRNWTGIETRRKMFYFLARGRIAELTGQLADCKDNLELAINMAQKGHFDELVVLSKYLQKIWRRLQVRSAEGCIVENQVSQTYAEIQRMVFDSPEEDLPVSAYVPFSDSLMKSEAEQHEDAFVHAGGDSRFVDIHAFLRLKDDSDPTQLCRNTNTEQNDKHCQTEVTEHNQIDRPSSSTYVATGTSPDSGYLDTPSFHNVQMLPLHSAAEPSCQSPPLSGRSLVGDTNLPSTIDRHADARSDDIFVFDNLASTSSSTTQRENTTTYSTDARSDVGQAPLQLQADTDTANEDSLNSMDLFG